MPMNSFLTSTWPSFGSGTGRSVLYCKTSVPPVFSIRMPFIVLGICWVEDDDAMVRGRWRWLLRRESRDVGFGFGIGLGSWWWGILVRMEMERDMQLGRMSIAVWRGFLG